MHDRLIALLLRLPLPLAFVLVGFFIWIAENVSTYFGAWVYPHQTEGWRLVGLGKVSSWSLLVIVTFIIVADLKHVKSHVKARRDAT